MINFEIISLLIFVLGVGGLLYRDRKNLELYYVIVIKKWDKGLELIDSFVKKHPGFTVFVGNAGVAFAFIAAIFGIIFLVQLTLQFQQTFSLVLPSAGGYTVPGPVISVPFWYWLITIFIIATSHETMHAVFIRLEKVKVKTYGIALLLILPFAAFVDPDARGIKKLSLIKKLRIFAAGSFINFVTGVFALGLIIASLFLFSSLAHSDGVVIDSVVSDSPAELIGLHGTIFGMNNQTIKNNYDLVQALNKTKPGDNVLFITDNGNYNLFLDSNPQNQNKSYVGITTIDNYQYNFLGSIGTIPNSVVKVFFSIVSFLNWLSGMALGIAIANILPAKPFDGGLFFEEIFVKLFGKRGKILINITTVLILSMLIFSILGIPIVKNLLT